MDSAEMYALTVAGKTAREIAAMIPGATKNSVIGSVYRYRASKGIPAPKKRTQKSTVPDNPKQPRLRIVKTVKIDKPITRKTGKMAFIDASTQNKCLWFIDQLCCGDDRYESKAYCEHHYQRSLSKSRA